MRIVLKSNFDLAGMRGGDTVELRQGTTIHTLLNQLTPAPD